MSEEDSLDGKAWLPIQSDHKPQEPTIEELKADKLFLEKKLREEQIRNNWLLSEIENCRADLRRFAADPSKWSIGRDKESYER